MYFYGFDWTYLYLVLPCMIFAMLASAGVNNTFNKSAAGVLPAHRLHSAYWTPTVSEMSALNESAAT